MAEQQLDAPAYPTSNIPPAKLGAPDKPAINGRTAGGVWSFLGQQVFPVITVPAGFTTQVYNRVRNPSAPLPPPSEGGLPTVREGTRLLSPIPARLPVGVDIVGRPYDEPIILKIAAAYEAATKHREPPKEFGPIAGAP